MDPIRLTFKKKMIAGLFVSIPAIITVIVLFWLFKFVDGLLSPAIDNILGRHITGLGFAATIFIIFILGIISTNVIGRKTLDWIERGMLHIPLFRTIYNPAKQVLDAFSGSHGAFKKFVVIEYPRPGLHAFGFLTNESIIKHPDESREDVLSSVYVPTNNLYLGEIVLIKKEDIIYTNLSVEEGIKIILSVGIAAPPIMLTEERKD